VRLVDIALGDGTTKRSVTHGSQRAATVLRALGITELDPPTPPQQDRHVVTNRHARYRKINGLGD
jgi:hypothetical protein